MQKKEEKPVKQAMSAKKSRRPLLKAAICTVPILFSSDAGLENRLSRLAGSEYSEEVIETAIKGYEELDEINADSSFDDELEQKLGIRILGYPTKNDISDLAAFYAAPENRQKIYLKNDVGVRRITFLPLALLKHTNNLGRAVFERGEIQLFSGLMKFNGIIDHEFAHMGVNYLSLKESPFFSRWWTLTGSYNHVEQRTEDGILEYIYKDNPSISGPLHGYVMPYGGKSLHEDVATYVECIVTEPEIFGKVTEQFEIYEKKIGLLKEYQFVIESETAKALKHLEKARDANGVK